MLWSVHYMSKPNISTYNNLAHSLPDAFFASGVRALVNGVAYLSVSIFWKGPFSKGVGTSLAHLATNQLRRYKDNTELRHKSMQFCWCIWMHQLHKKIILDCGLPSIHLSVFLKIIFKALAHIIVFILASKDILYHFPPCGEKLGYLNFLLVRYYAYCQGLRGGEEEQISFEYFFYS